MILNQLVEEFEPLKTKKVSDRLELPWINDTVTAEVRKRRLQKIWQKDINNNDKYQVFTNTVEQCATSSTKLKRISTKHHYMTTRMISRKSSISVTIS